MQDHMRGRRHARRLQYIRNMPESERTPFMERVASGETCCIRLATSGSSQGDMIPCISDPMYSTTLAENPLQGTGMYYTGGIAQVAPAATARAFRCCVSGPSRCPRPWTSASTWSRCRCAPLTGMLAATFRLRREKTGFL